VSLFSFVNKIVCEKQVGRVLKDIRTTADLLLLTGSSATIKPTVFSSCLTDDLIVLRRVLLTNKGLPDYL
jgi:hypothetical protein